MFGMMNMGIIVTMKDMLSGPAMKVVKSVKDIERVSNFGAQLTKSGAAATAFGALYSGIATEMKGRAFDLARPLYEFEDSLAAVRAAAPGTFGSVQSDIVEVTKRAELWEQAHKQGAVSYVQANYRMISAGLDTRTAIEGTDAALTLATATMGDATTASNLLATLYNNLGDKTAPVRAEMNRLADVVTKTQLSFQLADLGQLNEGLKYATKPAIQYRMELSEVSATIGLLNTAGLQGGMAGTAFGAMMRNVYKAARELRFEVARTASGGVDLAGTLENLQQRFAGKLDLPKTQMALQQAFGDEGLSAVTLLLNNMGKMRTGVNDVRGALGVAADKQREFEATGSSMWQKLGNNVDAMKRKVALSLTPAISDLIPKIESAAKWVGEFATAHPDILKTASYMTMVAFAVLSILGPVAIVGGVIFQVIGNAIKTYAILAKAIIWATRVKWAENLAWLASPITLAIVAYLACAAAVAVLVYYWKDLTNWMDRQHPIVKRLIQVWGVLLGPIVWVAWAIRKVADNWGLIKSKAAEATTATVGFFRDVGTMFGLLEGDAAAAGTRVGFVFVDQLWSALQRVIWPMKKLFNWIGEKLGIEQLANFDLANLGKPSEWAGIDMARPGPAMASAQEQSALGAQLRSLNALDLTDLGAQLRGIDVPDVKAAPLVVSAEVLASARGEKKDAASKPMQVSIGNLNVMAKDVAERESFERMIRGLGMEVAVGG